MPPQFSSGDYAREQHESFISSFQSGANSPQEVLCAIDHLWGGFTTNPKSFQAFLVETGPPSSHDVQRWVGFWTQSDRIHYTEFLPETMASKCYALAMQYTKAGRWAHAQLLALNGAFMQQCTEYSIRFIMRLAAKDMNETNLPVFFAAAKNILHCQNCCHKHIKAMESKTLKNLPERRADPASNERDIKIIISDQVNGVDHEKTIKRSWALKSVLGAYALECGVSLCSLRFAYNGSTLFMSSLGNKSAIDLDMNQLDTIIVCSNHSSQPSDDAKQSSQKSEIKAKKSKIRSGEKSRLKKKPRKPPKPISVPLTEEQLKETHSILLSKIFEEADPVFRAIRRKLTNLALEYKRPKNKSLTKKKRNVLQSTEVFNPNINGQGGKAGKSSYVINVGQIENLYISSKRSKPSLSSITHHSAVDLHGCNRDQAIQTLEAALVDWMDIAMKGEYPWVHQAIIVCGGGNQILSETVNVWIKEKKNVAKAPKRSL